MCKQQLLYFYCKLTAYFPPPPGGYASAEEAKMEGGALDRMGKPLHTLQAAAAGLAPYCAVAMDLDAFPYGTRLSMPYFDKKYGRPIEFRVVDTGGAFIKNGRHLERMDVCVDKGRELDAIVNSVHLVIAEVAG